MKKRSPSPKAKRAATKPAIKLPEFKSEAEEAAWWYANQDLVGELMKKHGRPVASREVEPSKIVTLRLYESDINRARTVAKQKGMKYQTYIKMLLHEALQREAS